MKWNIKDNTDSNRERDHAWKHEVDWLVSDRQFRYIILKDRHTVKDKYWKERWASENAVTRLNFHRVKLQNVNRQPKRPFSHIQNKKGEPERLNRIQRRMWALNGSYLGLNLGFGFLFSSELGQLFNLYTLWFDCGFYL